MSAKQCVASFFGHVHISFVNQPSPADAATSLRLITGARSHGPRRCPHITFRFEPIRLASLAEPFDHPDWIYELKHDGWRCLVFVSDGLVRLVSRYGHYYTRFATLAREIGHILKGREAVRDGELVCLDDEGKSQFYDLLRQSCKALLIGVRSAVAGWE